MCRGDECLCCRGEAEADDEEDSVVGESHGEGVCKFDRTLVLATMGDSSWRMCAIFLRSCDVEFK